MPAKMHVMIWRAVLAPWRQLLDGMLRLSPTTLLTTAPTRSDVEALSIELSIDRIGRDRTTWWLALEALELFHWLFRRDPQLCWTFVLEACGQNIKALSFPPAWLDEVCPTYVVRLNERDLVESDRLDGIELVLDIADAMLFGLPTWHHSPLFFGLEATLVNGIKTSHGRRPSCICVTWAFAFRDDPPEDIDMRLECLDNIKRLAVFLQTYQEPAAVRFWDDGAFVFEAFQLDFGDCYLLTDEVANVTDTMRAFPISSLTFSTWRKTSPSRVNDFCTNVIASVSDDEDKEVGMGLQSLTVYAMDLQLMDRFMFAHAITMSRTLSHVTFVDAGHFEPVLMGWSVLMLDTLFGDDTASPVESVKFVLSRTTAQEIALAQSYLESKYTGRIRLVDHELGINTLLPLDPYQVSIHGFPSRVPIPDTTNSNPTETTAINHSQVSTSGGVRVVMPMSMPYRLAKHPVRFLTISLRPGDGPSTTIAEAVTLVWLVGEPVWRLSLVGPPVDRNGCKMVLTAKQLEQVLTACPQLYRLEVHSIDLESLEPLTDSSLSGRIRSLVLDRCDVHDATSILDFYAVLGTPSHDFFSSLEDLSMSDQDDGVSTRAALNMLARNNRLARFVLLCPWRTSVRDLQPQFRRFHNQVIAHPQTTIAFLSVLDVVFDLTDDDVTKAMRAMVTRVLAFAETPMRRHCTVVPV